MVIVLTDLIKKGYSADNQSDIDSAYKCVSCKPGYKPLYDDKKFINQCILVENCLEVQFNGCKWCNENFSFYYSLNHKSAFYD